MPRDHTEYSPAGLARQRLNDLLGILAEQGITQAKVAARARLPTQYLSDIKRGRRPMTELVARRIGEEFDVNFLWLLGTNSTMAQPQGKSPAGPERGIFWLPLFPHPIAGEPRAHPSWEGTGVELAGVAASQLVLAQQPYVLRFGQDDVQGRLRRGDLILISQVVNDDAEISVVSQRRKSFLARANADGSWTRVANGQTLSAECPSIGHCLGVVWSSLHS